ncbi:MAG: hypothetical protein FWD15_01115 [Alphaproteobacteria bacterium]|nr:hypothetical protein [Alphaproteobacteria bacterium]
MQLKPLILEIVKKCLALKDKTVGEPDAILSWVCIFAQDETSYVNMDAEAASIGRVVDDTPSGKVYEIPPLDTPAGILHILKIRKLDITRPELGDCDFTLADYTKFKHDYLGKPSFKLIERGNAEMIELMEEGGDVRVYFSNPPVSYPLLLVQS